MPDTADATDDAPAGQPAGLRERKRLATRQRIISAARQGVLHDGVEALTVEAIARVADVSPRSFFNYFPTKEAAIIGTRGDGPESLEHLDLDDLPGDLAGAVATVVTTVLAARMDDPHDEVLRAVLQRFPQLLDISRAQWKQELRTATDTVARLLDHRGVAPDDGAVLAPTLVAMCVATIKADLPTAAGRGDDDAARVATIASAMRNAAVLLGAGSAR